MFNSIRIIISFFCEKLQSERDHSIITDFSALVSKVYGRCAGIQLGPHVFITTQALCSQQPELEKVFKAWLSKDMIGKYMVGRRCGE